MHWELFFSYILPHPFYSQVMDNYLLESLWPYLEGLFEWLGTLQYVGMNPHGQHQLTSQNPH